MTNDGSEETKHAQMSSQFFICGKTLGIAYWRRKTTYCSTTDKDSLYGGTNGKRAVTNSHTHENWCEWGVCIRLDGVCSVGVGLGAVSTSPVRTLLCSQERRPSHSPVPDERMAWETALRLYWVGHPARMILHLHLLTHNTWHESSDLWKTNTNRPNITAFRIKRRLEKTIIRVHTIY